MKFALQPWQLFVVIPASWINRQQKEVIEYLQIENAVLKGKLGKKRILLSDDQRRRLAVKRKVLGRRRLELYGTLFSRQLGSGLVFGVQAEGCFDLCCRLAPADTLSLPAKCCAGSVGTSELNSRRTRHRDARLVVA